MPFPLLFLNRVKLQVLLALEVRLCRMDLRDLLAFKDEQVKLSQDHQVQQSMLNLSSIFKLKLVVKEAVNEILQIHLAANHQLGLDQP